MHCASGCTRLLGGLGLGGLDYPGKAGAQDQVVLSKTTQDQHERDDAYCIVE